MERVTLGARELVQLVRDPSAMERHSAAAGVGLTVLDVRTRRDADRLESAVGPGGQALRDLPGAALSTVLVALVEDPRLAACVQFADVVLVGSERESVEAIGRTVGANPLAALAFSLLLRSSPLSPAWRDDATVMAGLVAESTTFSMLQAGPEFQRWRANTPVRPDRSGVGGERVRATRRGDCLDIVLCRPEQRNAFDVAMRDALTEALTTAVSTPGLRVRLSGEGLAFCSGGDLDEFGLRPDPVLAHVARLTRSAGWLMHLVSSRAQVRLHGSCLGSGIEISAFARRAVAAPDVRLGLPEIALGLIPGAGGTVSLPQRIGRHRTAYLALSGKQIGAETALAWGLVDVIEERAEPASRDPSSVPALAAPSRLD